MDTIFIKTEERDVFLHITVNINDEGKIDKMVTVGDKINLPQLICSKFNSQCPTCECPVTINIIVHDTNEDKHDRSDKGGDIKLSVDSGPDSPTFDLPDVGKFDSDSDINLATSLLKVEQKDTPSSIDLKLKIATPDVFEKIVTKKKAKKRLKGSEPRVKGHICVYCFEPFPTEKAQIDHYVDHNLKCKFCEETLPNKSKLQIHVRKLHFNHHPKSATAQVCSNCGKTFSYEGYQIHRRNCIYPSGEPMCHICNRTFVRWSYVTKHIQNIHEGKKEFTCDICGKQFALKIMFDEHCLTHEWNDPRPYKCHHCPDLAVKTRFLIKNHMRDKHLKIPKKMKKCKECGKEYPSKYKLEEHMLRHLEIRPFQCSFCSKSFFRKAAMQDHEKIHRDIRPFSCDICGHRFRQKQGMFSHRRLHTGEKPYQCELCQQRFADRGCYRSHITKHEKELGVTLDKSVRKFGVTSKKKAPDPQPQQQQPPIVQPVVQGEMKID